MSQDNHQRIIFSIDNRHKIAIDLSFNSIPKTNFVFVSKRKK